MTRTATAVAGLGVAGCDHRTSLGVDQRAPSAPTGLLAGFSEADNAVLLVWNAHPLTDFLGTRSEKSVFFKVYRNGILVTPIPILENTFTDYTVSLKTKYVYQITAVDTEGHESAPSDSAAVMPGAGKPLSIFRSDTATSGLSINASVVKNLLDTAILDFTGQTDLGAAYASFFPGITTDKIIAVKINTLAGAMLSTHPPVVEALVSGLTQMLGGTYPAYNIIVFDDRDGTRMGQARFPLRDTPGLYRVVSTQGNWAAQKYVFGNTEQYLSAVAASADYLVNVPVLKDHSEAGITFALKNYYGLISSPGSMHANYCDPMISDVYHLVRDKTRLIVGDALFGAYQGGPSISPNIQPSPNSIYVGTDPVAMDLYALWRINKERAKKGKPLISCEPGNPAQHILTAGGAPYFLGDSGFVASDNMETTI